MKKIKILHIITKLAIGGAQENTIYNVEHLNRQLSTFSEIACGPLEKDVGNLEVLAESKGINLVKISGMTNDIHPLANIRAFYQLYVYLKKNKFDIVHTHSSVAGIIGRITARLAKTPIVIHTVHGWGIRDDMSVLKKKIYINLERICEKFTDKLIAVSKFNVDKGLKYGIGKASKYIVIHSGIDIGRYSRRFNIAKKKQELGISEDARVIGTVGRLDIQKNPLDFVRMAKIITNDFPNCVFVIVGDGPLRKQTKEFIGENKLEMNFRLLGFRDDVEEIIPCFDIFVLSSLWEGLPRVFLQAMAAKKPIVATDVDGAPEAIINGNNGFIVETKKPGEMAKKAIYLLSHPKKADAMGKNGFEMVHKFSLNKMLQDIDNLYRSLLKKKKIYKDL